MIRDTVRIQAEREGWASPFPRQEYQRRVNSVRKKMSQQGIDLLLVSSPPNITYLTGYDMIWYNLTTPTSVGLRTDQENVLFFDSASHKVLVELHATVDEAVYFQRSRGAVDLIIRSLADRGWLKGRVGIERWSRAPHGNILAEIETRFRNANVEVVDGSWIVDEVRQVKSRLEIEVVRKAAAIADKGMEAALREIRPGVREIEIEGAILYAMMQDGGGDPAIRITIRSGPRTSAHHTPATQRQVEGGDLVWVNHCGSYHRYHVDIGRVISLGEPDIRWIELVAKASGSITHVLNAIRPGDPMEAVQKAADEYIDSVGLRRYVWLVGGYSLGIAIPPDWVGHTWLRPESGFRAASYDPGTVTNYENRFDVLDEGWRGGRGAGFIDTLLMTEAGLEVLSKLDRKIAVVE